MAEQWSAEERIELWYEQQMHALWMTGNDWYRLTSLSNERPDAERYVLNTQEFVEVLQHRIDFLAQNPAEVVQDRLDASRDHAEASLQRSDVEHRAYSGDALDREAYEARGSDPRVEAAQERLFAEQLAELDR